MIQKTVWLLAILMLCASASFSQSRTIFVGDVELRLGMSQEAAMKLLSKYRLTVSGKSFTVGQFSQVTKQYEHLGYITFEDGRLAYISRSLDTSAWPRDEGFSVARAIYDALSGSITRTDSNGAKRTNAQIVISNQDGSAPAPVNLRTISIYVEDRKIVVLIADGADGKSVSAQVDISAKPW